MWSVRGPVTTRRYLTIWRCRLSRVVWHWQDSGLFSDDVELCQSQTQYLIRGMLFFLTWSVLLRELTVRAAKKTAPSHGAESLSRVEVAFQSSHQSCQLWRCFWGGQSSESMWSVLSLPSPTIRPREQADLARYRSFVVNQWRFGF